MYLPIFLSLHRFTKWNIHLLWFLLYLFDTLSSILAPSMLKSFAFISFTAKRDNFIFSYTCSVCACGSISHPGNATSRVPIRSDWHFINLALSAWIRTAGSCTAAPQIPLGELGAGWFSVSPRRDERAQPTVTNAFSSLQFPDRGGHRFFLCVCVCCHSLPQLHFGLLVFLLTMKSINNPLFEETTGGEITLDIVPTETER